MKPVKGKYAFENAIIWSNFKPFILKQNLRQSENGTYASILNRARVGLLNEEDLKILQSRLIKPPQRDISSLLHFFPTLKEVQQHNNMMQVLLSRECTEVKANLLAFNYQKVTPPVKALEEYTRLRSLTE